MCHMWIISRYHLFWDTSTYFFKYRSKHIISTYLYLIYDVLIFQISSKYQNISKYHNFPHVFPIYVDELWQVPNYDPSKVELRKLRASVNVSWAPKLSRRSDEVFDGKIPRISMGLFNAGWWFGTCFIFHFIYGMSSFPLTNSYFSRWLLHNQPEWIGHVL